MGQTTEKIPERISPYYNSLSNIDDYVQASQEKPVELIIIEICAQTRELNWVRKVDYLRLRETSQDAQNRLSDEKATNLRQTSGLLLEGASVVCYVVSAFWGGQTNMAGGSFSALGQAFTSAANYREKVMKASEETLGHCYHRQTSVEREWSQEKQTAEKEMEENKRLIDRVTEETQRLAMTIAGG